MNDETQTRTALLRSSADAATRVFTLAVAPAPAA